jgi:hypothetical protein
VLVRSENAGGLIVLLGVLVACAGLFSGCGKSQVNSTAPAPGPTGPALKVAATGPAIATALSFDQLALESSVKKVKGKNALVFLHFSYADLDGRIYKCELPDAMSKGSYSPEEWTRTFNIYRLPQVIGRKKVKKGGPVVIGDFPFVSPRPQKVETTTQPQTPSTQLIPMPTLPSMPQPQNQPMNPRGMPSVSPRPPMD